MEHVTNRHETKMSKTISGDSLCVGWGLFLDRDINIHIFDEEFVESRCVSQRLGHVELRFVKIQILKHVTETEIAHMGYRGPAIQPQPRWRHYMETFSALLALGAGSLPVAGEFHTQRPVVRSFNVFFDLRLNKWLSKQSWGWWLETPSPSSGHQCNGYSIHSRNRHYDITSGVKRDVYHADNAKHEIRVFL